MAMKKMRLLLEPFTISEEPLSGEEADRVGYGNSRHGRVVYMPTDYILVVKATNRQHRIYMADPCNLNLVPYYVIGRGM